MEKIWFFCVKSWFFTRNTQKMFAPPSARRKFLSAPPLTWNPGSAPETILQKLWYLVTDIGYLTEKTILWPTINKVKFKWPRGGGVWADLFIVQPTRKYFGSVKKNKNPRNTHFWTFGPLVWDRVFQIDTNLYSVPRTFVLNIQKDRSNRTKVMARKP
jgi:hypothetical protein